MCEDYTCLLFIQQTGGVPERTGRNHFNTVADDGVAIIRTEEALYWCMKWKIVINGRITFFLKGRRRNLVPLGHLQINGNNNSREIETKYLKVITYSLTFTKHFEKTKYKSGVPEPC